MGDVPTDRPLDKHGEQRCVLGAASPPGENDDYISKVGEEYAQISLESLQAAAPDPFDRKYPQWGQQYSEATARYRRPEIRRGGDDGRGVSRRNIYSG